MKKHVSVGDEDKVGDVEGGAMDGAIDGDKDGLMLGDDDDEGIVEGDQLMLGDRDEDGVWLIDGTAEGAAGKNGRENLVASLLPKSPPSVINTPFDVTL
mmetsp:Transcript_17195/g.30297  ORF Transcript_17195/g.30297 Transcript_17195/m.30297 type:complete len:99 (-) Transcript_17195:124-420(-)